MNISKGIRILWSTLSWKRDRLKKKVFTTENTETNKHNIMPLPENQKIMKSVSLQGTVFKKGTFFPMGDYFYVKKKK